jgi:toxin ParE1/3/4
MRQLVVSEHAEADLREIWLYSYQNWGEAQADRYLDELDAGLRTCGAAPDRGRRRDEVRPGYWSLLIRRHVAFYTVTDDEVLVQRVLHGSMEPDLHLDEE